MRFSVLLCALLAPNSALAHPGHLIEVAGHDHLLAGAAIGIAIGLGIWGAVKGPKSEEEAEELDAEEEAQPA